MLAIIFSLLVVACDYAPHGYIVDKHCNSGRLREMDVVVDRAK